MIYVKKLKDIHLQITDRGLGNKLFADSALSYSQGGIRIVCQKTALLYID